jgi:excinuclease ABC subunit B
MAEELADYLKKDFKVAYLHSDIATLERSDILDKLRSGDFDVLVGINLLREGLDLPEVSLVLILDAGQQGFLRSRSALIQIMGRASRHLGGQVILYADEVSKAMRQAIAEVNRRRQIQLKYNDKYHLTPQSVTKTIRPKLIQSPSKVQPDLLTFDPLSLTPNQRKSFISKLKREMRSLALDLNFEQAIRLRDRIKEIEKF